MSNRFPTDDEHLHPYPGNLKHHKVDKEERRKLLCEMMADDAKSGLYNERKREPLPGKVLTDEEIEIVANVEHVETGNAASGMWREGFVEGMRYARDNGYLAPSAGLTVEEAMECIHKWIGLPFIQDDLRARLTAAINAKQKP